MAKRSKTVGTSNGGKVWTYTILRVYVEATQRGYIVGVEADGRRGRGRVDLSSHTDDGSTRGVDAAYAAASLTAESVERGRWYGRRAYGRDPRECSLAVEGRTLTVKRDGVAPAGRSVGWISG